MPTYEYSCTKCGEHVEVAQSFRDDPLTKCPSCGGKLRKVFGNVGIVFKGSGFYKTDSRTSQKAHSSSSSEKESASSESSSSTPSSDSSKSSDSKTTDSKSGDKKPGDSKSSDSKKKESSGASAKSSAVS
jgi:putative FmdB family regulatory protein